MVGRLLVNLLIRHRKYKFKQWIELEDRKIKIFRASGQDREKFPQLVMDFLPDALPIPKWVWERMSGDDVMTAFYGVCNLLTIRTYLPIISLSDNSKEKGPDITWNYNGRIWNYYSHLLAHAYGWSLEYIANLNAYEAMAHVEEILTSQQLEREFQWSMSEASVSYDDKTKTTKPNPLPRPYWMKQAKPDEPLPIKRTNIPKSMMPIGVVSYEGIPEELRPKETKPQ